MADLSVVLIGLSVPVQAFDHVDADRFAWQVYFLAGSLEVHIEVRVQIGLVPDLGQGAVDGSDGLVVVNDLINVGFCCPLDFQCRHCPLTSPHNRSESGCFCRKCVSSPLLLSNSRPHSGQTCGPLSSSCGCWADLVSSACCSTPNWFSKI